MAGEVALDSDDKDDVPGSAKPENIVLVSLDCVRREALSCTGIRFPWWRTLGMRPMTPVIDTIAGAGTSFGQAICQAPFTPASHASLFTGLNPYHHGIRGMFGFRLEPSAETLAQVLKRSGYRTAAFIGSHALGTQYDLHKGFDVYDEHFEQSRGTSWVLGHRRAATEVTQRALEWLEAADSRPFFLFLHYFDAHGAPPCTGPQGGEVEDVPTLAAEGPVRGLPSRRKLRRRLKRRWRARSTRSGYGERYHLARVREIDANLGKLVGLLRQRRAYDHTSIFIVSDHGDAFGEHGETGHREFLYDTTLRVPLIVKCPLSVPGTVEESLVRVIDIFPTVLAVLGVHTPDVDGTCLFPPSAGLAQKQLRAYSETRFQLSPDAPLELDSSLDSLRTSRWKLIRDHLAGSAMLFDLCADPGERKDVKSRYPEVARRLHAELEQLTRDAGPAEPTPSSSAERAQIKELLKSLGYL